MQFLVFRHYENSGIILNLHPIQIFKPMKKSTSKRPASLTSAEKNSENILMEKMGMSRKEIQEVYNKYGVSPSRLIELMQLSKYQFVYSGKVPGQCEPCHNMATSLRAVNY